MANVGYIRVSSQGQNTERQLDGILLDKVFSDTASGASLDRVGIKNCLDYLREGDTLFIHSIDRLARNLSELLKILTNLTAKGIAIKFVKENLLFESNQNNPLQELLLHVIGACAQFERSLIRERQREGIALAKKKGIKCGRPLKVTKEIKENIAADYKNMCIKELCKKYNLGRSTIYAILNKKYNTI